MELSVDRNDCVAKFDGDDAFGINGLIEIMLYSQRYSPDRFVVKPLFLQSGVNVLPSAYVMVAA